MKDLVALVAALAVTLAFVLSGGAARAADGKLSSAEWKKVEAEAEAALAAKDLEQLRKALDRAAEDGSARALKLIEKVAAASETDAALPACTKAAKALSDAKVKKELRKDALGAKNVRVKVALAGALEGKDADDAPVLQKLMTDASEDVAIAAIRELAQAKVESAIEPMIALMEKQDAARGPIWEELRYALSDLLGGKLNSGAEYRSRWKVLKEKGGTKAIGTPADPGAQADPKANAGGHRTVELFGREVACTRVVFILDVSGSMTAVDNPDLPIPEEGGGTRGKDPKAEPKQGPDPRSRMERAKRELKKVLKGLPKGTRANIVAFSTSVKIWKGGFPPVLHLLDDATRDEACKWVDTLSADGTTATDDALSRAFEVEGARCFYLLSDGEPTKDGQTRIPTETILKLIEEKNGTRKVRIHTLGFVGADVDFMKAVAAATGGEYSDIK